MNKSDNNIVALILAAGEGNRYGSELPKQFQELNDKTLLDHSIQTFDNHPHIKEYGVMYPEGFKDEVESIIESPATDKLKFLTSGGATRRESVKFGLEAFDQNSIPDMILVHDAARPGVSGELLDKLINTYFEENHDFKGVIPALPVRDTIKTVTDETPTQVDETLDRNRLRKIQTPQLFDFETLRDVHAGWDDSRSVTDDAMMLETHGYSIGITQGSQENRKVTVKEDLLYLETLLGE